MGGRRWVWAAGLFALHGAAALAQEKIAFPSNNTDIAGSATTIEGYLYRPPGDGPFPAVVGLHGCSGMLTRDRSGVSPLYAQWGQHLKASGFVVLLVDSFTPRKVTSVCGVAQQSDVEPSSVRPRDAYGALLHLQAQPYVRPDRIAVMGWSHGGGTTLYTVAPVARGRPSPLKHDFAAAIPLYPGWCRLNAHGASWKPVMPMLALIAGADDWTPAEPCVALLEGARSAGAAIDIVVYPGAHHAFDSPAPLRTLDSVKLPSGRLPTVGQDPAARADAYKRTVEFLRARLGG